MKYQYVAMVWQHTDEGPILVEKKKLKNIFTAQDYAELKEEEGFEVHLRNVESLSKLDGKGEQR